MPRRPLAALALALPLVAVLAWPVAAQVDDEGGATGAPAASGAPEALAPMPEPSYVPAVVQEVAPGASPSERRVTLQLEDGQRVEVAEHLSGQAGFDLDVAPGDPVVAVALPDPRNPSAPPEYQISDFQRARPVTWVLVGVAVALALVGGLRGLKTLGVLALTGIAVVGVLIPLTLKGMSPLPLAIGLAFAISLVTTLLTSGPGRKAWAAVLGSTGAVTLAAGLATGAAAMSRLSGVASDEAASAMATVHSPINFAGLLAAGMVIGALGVLMDLALSISAAVDELGEANPGLSRGLLFQAGMQVGRDMLSTSSNTLLLAYLGSFLPVLLGYGAQGLSGARLINQEALAAEAITLGVGLVGLLAGVPLTAAIATLLQPTAAAPAGR